jgi:hypothetical protein
MTQEPSGRRRYRSGLPSIGSRGTSRRNSGVLFRRDCSGRQRVHSLRSSTPAHDLPGLVERGGLQRPAPAITRQSTADHDSVTEKVRGEQEAAVRDPAIYPSPRPLSPCGVCIRVNGHGACRGLKPGVDLVDCHAHDAENLVPGCMPRTSSIWLREQSSFSASRLISARFAAASTGGAVTRIRNSPPCGPTIPLVAARG